MFGKELMMASSLVSKRLASCAGSYVLRLLIFVVLLFVLGGILVPGFLGITHIVVMLQAAFFLGMISLSQTVVTIAGKGGIDLSVGGMLVIGVVTGSMFLERFPNSLVSAFLLVAIVGFTLGLLNGIGVSVFDIPPLVMTMAMGAVLMGLALFVTSGIPSGEASIALKGISQGHLFIGGREHGLPIPYVLIIWAVVTVIVWFILNKTRIGFILYAVGSNERAARLQGVRTGRVWLFSYALSGMLACLAGILMLGYAGYPNLTLGEKYVMDSVAATVIGGVAVEGGKGSYFGAVLGSIIMVTIASVLSTLNLGEGVRQAISGGVILLILFSYKKRGS